MFERLLRKEGAYLDALVAIAVRATSGASLLRELFAEPALVDARASAIHVLHHEAEVIVHDLNVRPNTGFIGSIDSEDIRELGARLYDVMARIDGTAWRAHDFRIAEVREAALHLCYAIVHASARLDLMVREIKDSTALLAGAREVQSIGEEGDAVYFRAVSELFAGPRDPLTMLKWKEHYDRLEETVDACRQAAGVFERVAIKRA